MVARALPMVDRGGIQTLVWELARAMEGLGSEVTVYVHKADYPRDLPFAVETVPFIAAPRLTAVQFVTASLVAGLRLKHHRYDVVHGHSMYGWGAAIGGARPYVQSCHGTQLRELESILATGFDPNHVATDLTNLVMERWGARLADRVITLCGENSRDVHDQYGVPEGVIRTIPPGIHPERFSEARPEGPLVLFVGRLYPRKGIEHLLRAMPEVVGRVPGARLLVAGSGELEGRLHALARELGLGAAVEFLGYIPEDALPGLYARAAVAAMPSIYEGFGIVMLEAMASAVPVVAFRTGGAPELVRDGETGYLADPATLGDRIARVLEDPAGARAMGRRARGMVLADYTWRRAAERTLQVYEEAIASRA
jgi:glycosyltransferase involved in cell wall biosynthesis